MISCKINGYLTLSRQVGERITLGNDAQIEVRTAHGNQAKFSVEVPKETSIMRNELLKLLNQSITAIL